MEVMVAVVSVPWALASMPGTVLSGSRPMATREAPECDRVYFAIPVRVRFDTSVFRPTDDVDVHYFWTREEAMAWGSADAERRLMGEEE